MAAPAPRLWLRFLRPLAAQEPSFYRAVVACFLIAGTLWMLRGLNNVHTAALRYPISWRYNHQRYRPARPLPPTLRIEVQGRGWRLLM